MRGKVCLGNCYLDHSLVIYITEGSLGGSCVTAATDSCNDPNAQCVNDICECNEGYYDNDGISDNNAGTCILSKCKSIYLIFSVGRGLSKQCRPRLEVADLFI